ncbi:MAG: lipopolysaccharide biosynthesis protein [Cyanobacteria bacterium P01_E01_bin.48]
MKWPRNFASFSTRAGALSAVRITDAVAGVGVLAALTFCLPPSEVGSWFLMTGMILTAQAIFQFRSSEAIFTYLPALIDDSCFQASRRILRTSLLAELASGLVSAVALYFGFTLLPGDYFGQPLPNICITAAMAMCVVRGLQEPLDATIRAVQSSSWILSVGITTVILRASAIVGSAILYQSFEALVVALAVASLVNLVILAIAVAQTVNGNEGGSNAPTTPDTRELFKFLGFSSLISLLNVLVLRVDELLLGLFVAPTMVAGYGIARRISGMSDILFTPENEALFSSLSGIDDPGKRTTIVREANRRGVFLSLAVVIGLIAIAPVMYLLLEDRYPGIFSAVTLFAFTNLWFCRHWYRPLLATSGRQQSAAVFTFGSVFVFFTAAFLLTPSLGVTGLILSHHCRIVAWLWFGNRMIARYTDVIPPSSFLRSTT